MNEIPYIEDPIQEAKYQALEQLGKELKVPVPQAFLTMEVFDKNRKALYAHKQRSHSWTRNAYNLLFCNLAGKDMDDVTFEGGKLSLKTTAAAIKTANTAPWIGFVIANTPQSVDADVYGYRAGAGIEGFGIMVGSGVNAEDFEDFTLQTKITNGVGAGQLSYIATDAHLITYVGLTLKNTLVRYFNNNSGGDVIVNEVALVDHSLDGTGPGNGDHLKSRDALGAPITIPDTGQLKVTYSIQLTYPS